MFHLHITLWFLHASLIPAWYLLMEGAPFLCPVPPFPSLVLTQLTFFRQGQAHEGHHGKPEQHENYQAALPFSSSSTPDLFDCLLCTDHLSARCVFACEPRLRGDTQIVRQKTVPYAASTQLDGGKRISAPTFPASLLPPTLLERPPPEECL